MQKRILEQTVQPEIVNETMSNTASLEQPDESVENTTAANSDDNDSCRICLEDLSAKVREMYRQNFAIPEKRISD